MQHDTITTYHYDLLKNIPIFQGLNDDDLKLIIQLLEHTEYKPDMLIFKEGAYGDSMSIIIKGTVKVTKKEDTDSEVFVCHLKSGSYFGEFSLIDNLPRSASITAVEETELFVLRKEAFDIILSQERKIANIFYRNCLQETFSRFRDTISNFTFSQHVLHEKTSILNEINEDLSFAKKIQNFFLNTKYLNHESHGKDDIKHTYIYHPCIEIGGDFINITKFDESTMGIIIADVMGHGITAALATGVLKSAYSIYSEKIGHDPAELMRMLNQHFLTVISDLYATCYYAFIEKEKQTITFAKAGHHHPFFWKKKTGAFADIECSGSGLGLVHDAKFGKVEFNYEIGDKILFFTDGIIEQVNSSGDMYSESRLKDLFKSLIEKDEPKILDAIFEDLQIYSGDLDYEDDITLLLIEF